MSFWVVTEPVDQSPDVDPLVREAIAMVVRLTSGEATTADAVEIRQWRSQSPAHEAAFKQAAKLWKDFGTVAAAKASQQATRTRILGMDRVVARRAFLGGAIAAAAAGYVVVRPPLGLWPSWGELLADHRTGKGEQQKIAISPDISIELGTLTSVSVRSGANQPSIELISGEAAITSASAANDPLVVLAGDGRVTASQASFNARCLDGVVAVTCLTGTVEVEFGRQTTRLGVGQQVSYTSAGLGSVENVNLDQTTSWRSGMLVFHNKPLVDVIEEVNRYRPGRIVVTNSELGRRVVNGTFRRDQLETFIAQVQRLFGAKVTALPAGLVLLS